MEDKKIVKLKAKNLSFVMKLTKKDIIELLYKLGNYTLNENVYSEDDGKKLPAIERYYNPEKNEYQIMLRCKNNDTTIEELYNTLTIHMPFLVSGGYNPRNSIIILSDYMLQELNMGHDVGSNKQLIYAKFMYEKFGEYYKQKYNKYIRSKIKKFQTKE